MASTLRGILRQLLRHIRTVARLFPELCLCDKRPRPVDLSPGAWFLAMKPISTFPDPRHQEQGKVVKRSRIVLFDSSPHSELRRRQLWKLMAAPTRGVSEMTWKVGDVRHQEDAKKNVYEVARQNAMHVRGPLAELSHLEIIETRGLQHAQRKSPVCLPQAPK